MKKLYTLVSMMCIAALGFSQYYYIPHVNAGQNPGNLNQDDEYPVGGGLSTTWATIQGPSASAWSPVQTIPFTFNFNGSAVTQYKVSTTGVLTFTTTAGTVPGAPSALPSASIPDKSVCVWGISGSGSNDNIVTKTFGTAPNRQHWVFFSSYTSGSNWTYWSIVLEETTNKIYIVDQRHSAAISGLRLGVQINSTTATSVNPSPYTSVAGSNPSSADNTYYEFIYGTQPAYDMAATAESVPQYLAIGAAPFSITGTVQNNGTVTVTSFDINYTVNGGTAVTAAHAAVNITSGGSANFTHPTQWNPATSGTYTIEAWASNINGNPDQNTSNDKITFTVDVVDTVVTRNSCLEVFTSSTCGPCAPGNAQMDNNVVPTISNYTIVKYQQNFPGSGDPYQTTESVNRRGYYAINSIPRMEIDGQWDGNANSFTKPIFQSYQQLPSFMTIDITSATYTGTTATINATITPHITYAAGTYKYHVVINEKKTTGNVASNGETEFHHVMMDMIPNENGNAISSLTKGVAIPVTKTQNLSSSNVEQMSDLEVVVFVQDNGDKKILQSAWKDISAAGSTGINDIDENNEGIASLYPNPTNNNATVRYQINGAKNVSVIVRDMMGKEVISENIGSVNGVNYYIINTSELPNGIYMVNLIAGDKSFSNKLMVTK